MGRLKQKAEEILNKLTGRGKRLVLCCIAGLAGMGLILFSGTGDRDPPPVSSEDTSPCTDSFCTDTEQRLCRMLSSIEGVGRAEVMITAESSEEYIYAESEKTSGDRTEQGYVILKKGQSEEALVKSVIPPRITGAAVVCEGGGKDRVREEVYKTVSAVLGIPVSRIYVAELKH